MKITKFAALATMALVLAGCASSQRLSDEDRARTKTVVVNANVQKGELFLLAPGGANVMMALGGALGGLAASDAIANNTVVFGRFLDRSAVSIQAIVHDEFEKVLRESGKVAIAQDPTAALPVISVSVPQYGFGVTHAVSSNVVPILRISVEMKDRGGRVLWSGSEGMSPSIASPMESTAWTALGQDPWVIEEQWRKAARYLAEKVVRTL